MSITIQTGGDIVVELEVGQGPAGPSTAAAQAAQLASEQAATRSNDAANRADQFAASAAGSSTAAQGAASSALSSRDAAQSAADRAESADAMAQQARMDAQAALDEFTDIYLGRFAVEPMTDNDGNPLQIGALYYDTTLPQLKVYTAQGWNTAYFSPEDVVIEAELQAAILAHEQKADPHPQYTTVQEAAAAAPVQVAFKSIAVMGQGTVEADSPTDTLNLVAGSNIILTTNPMDDSVTITSVAQAAAASVAVLDEGSLLTTSATSLNFVGEGVTATTNMDAVTVNVPTFPAFGVVTGDTGTASADGVTDSLAIVGGAGIITEAQSTPDTLMVVNTDRGTVAVAAHEAATDPHPQYTTVQEAAAAAPVQVAFQTITGNTGSAVADTATDSLSIVGTDGLSTTASDTPDQLTITPTFGTPGTIQPDATAGAGTAASFARSDHRHAIQTDPPVALGATAAEGTSNAFARADHVHPYPTAAQVGAASLSFVNIAVAGQGTVVADTATDTLTLVAGTNVTITTDPATDAITISSTGGGGGGGNSAAGNVAFMTLGGY